MEVAALGLKIEGVEGIDRAAASLDGLAAAGVKAEKSTQGVGKGSAGAKPSVDALAASAEKAAQAEARLATQAEKAGISVGQMKAALRGVPAQFTDIAVSLQGGMSPLTVFLQQGGQLKDMFGGAGSAARALGGYVTGLINPFTITAAAVAAVGVAYFQGSKEQDAFMVSMAKTGNAAGVTTSGLRSYAEQISATVGTQGKAAESLNIFIDSGVKAGASLARLTETAIAWEKATGEGVDKVAAKYVALQNDPLKAAMKLNEGMNFLTLSVYEQVKSLEEQGRTTDAAKVAMDALDSAMAERSKTIEQNLGAIQKAWNGVAGAAKWAWDKMLNVGREDSIDQQLSKARESLDKLQTEAPGLMEKGTHTARLKRMQEVVSGLEAQSAAESLNAAATEHSAKAVASKAAWDKIVTANASKQTKMELELENVRNKALAAGIKGKTLDDELIAVREKYAEKTKKVKKEVDATKGAYDTFITSIESKIAANEAELFSAGKLTESAKLQIELDTKVKTGKLKLSEAQKALAQDGIKRLAEQEKEQNAIARSIALNDERVASQEEMNKAMADMDRQVIQVKLATFEYSQTLSDQIEMTDLETRTIGMNSQARQVMIEQLRIEQDLRKRREAIKSAPFASDEARNVALSDLDAQGAKAIALAQRKAYVSEWEKTSQMIGDTLSDYIMGGGKDAAQYLKRLFSTLVLQPIVQSAVGGLMGSSVGSGAGGSALGTAGSVQSIWSGLSGGLTSSLGGAIAGLGTQLGSTAATAFGSGIAAGGQLGLFGGGISQGMSLIGSSAAGSTAAGLGTIAGALAPWIAGASALYSIIKGFDDSGTPHSGAGAIYSAAGGLQTGAGIYNQATFGLGHPDEYSEAMQSGVSEITKGLSQTLDAFSLAFGKTAGYSVATAFADDSSKDGAWGSLKIADEVGKVLVDWGTNRESKFAPREFANGEAGYKEYLNTVAMDVKSAFVSMGLPGWADQILKTATDIDTLNAALQQISSVKSTFDSLGKTMSIFAGLSGELQTKLLAASGGIESLVTSAGAFYEGFFTEGERAQKQRELQMKSLSGMGLYIDPYQGDEAKELFRKTVEEAMSSGQMELAAKLLAMSGSFAQTADYAQNILEETAEKAKKVADERAGLEQQLMQLEGDTVGLRALERDALDETNRALYDQINALTDAAQVSQERAGLERQLMQLQKDTVGLRALERDALDETNRALYDQINALTDAKEAAEIALEWDSLARTMSMFSGITANMQSSLISAAGSMEELISGAQNFNQAFYSSDERALGQRDVLMGSLGDLGLYIDPAEGEKAKELFRKTVEEAMATGQTELAAKLLLMSDSFAVTADYAQQFFDKVKESAKIAAQNAAQSMAKAWSSFTTVAGLAAQYTGNTSGLTAQLGVVQGSYANATTTEGRVGALQQIINLEQGLFNAQQDARQAEVQAATARANAAREQLNSVNQLLGAAKGLGDYVKQLRFSQSSGLSEAQRATALQKEYNSLLGRARSGDINAMQDLQSVTGNYLTLAEQMSGTQQDYTAISTRMAAELAATAAIQEAAASSQAARLEQQIAFAESTASTVGAQFKVSEATQKLIDELLIESATAFETESTLTQTLIDQGAIANDVLMSLPAELAGAIGTTLLPAIRDIAYVMAQAAGIDGSHAGGLSSVPFNGYRAILHKDEAVLTAEENRAYRSGSSSSSTTSVSNEVLSVLLGIKNDNRLAAEQGLSLQLRIARRLDDWNGNGLPATREETA